MCTVFRRGRHIQQPFSIDQAILEMRQLSFLKVMLHLGKYWNVFYLCLCQRLNSNKEP